MPKGMRLSGSVSVTPIPEFAAVEIKWLDHLADYAVVIVGREHDTFWWTIQFSAFTSRAGRRQAVTHRAYLQGLFPYIHPRPNRKGWLSRAGIGITGNAEWRTVDDPLLYDVDQCLIERNTGSGHKRADNAGVIGDLPEHITGVRIARFYFVHGANFSTEILIGDDGVILVDLP